MSARSQRRIVQSGFVIALVLAWYWSTATGRINPLLLPSFTSVMRDFATLISSGSFLPDLQITMYELVVAYALAASAGLIAGFLASRTRFSVRMFDPLFSSLYAVPMVLLYPLFVLFFGLGVGSKIAIGAVIAFFPIVLNTISGLANVDRAYITAAQSMGASAFQLFWIVMLPAAFPVMLTGLRMGLVHAFLAILGTETIASFSGLGHRIVAYADNMEMSKMFAYTMLVLCIAIVLNVVVNAIEKRGRGSFQ